MRTWVSTACPQSGSRAWEDMGSGGGQLTVPLELGSGCMSALERHGHVHVLSSPLWSWYWGKKPTSKRMRRQPFEARDSGAQSVAFKKAVLALHVNPLPITQAHVEMKIVLQQDRVSPHASAQPSIDTQSLHTVAQVQMGKPLGLGGVAAHQVGAEAHGIPGLEDLPWVGQWFAHQQHQEHQQQLLIFVTPFFVPIDG